MYGIHLLWLSSNYSCNKLVAMLVHTWIWRSPLMPASHFVAHMDWYLNQFPRNFSAYMYMTSYKFPKSSSNIRAYLKLKKPTNACKLLSVHTMTGSWTELPQINRAYMDYWLNYLAVSSEDKYTCITLSEQLPGNQILISKYLAIWEGWWCQGGGAMDPDGNKM